MDKTNPTQESSDKTKITTYMPPAMRDELKTLAAMHDMSLNQLSINLYEQLLDKNSPFRKRSNN